VIRGCLKIQILCKTRRKNPHDPPLEKAGVRSFPSSGLGTQARKLLLPVPLEYQVAPTCTTKPELPSRWVPKPELGNQLWPAIGGIITRSKLSFLLPSGSNITNDRGRTQDFSNRGAHQDHTEFNGNACSVLPHCRYHQQFPAITGRTGRHNLTVALPMPRP
jgi:hypothetical protein